MIDIRNFNNTDGLYCNFKKNEIPALECWTPITSKSAPNVMPIYMISDWDRVFNTKTNSFINQSLASGYLLVALKTYNGKYILRDIHRIVIIEFVGFDPDKNKNEVDHISGEKNNNSIYNIRWVTPSQNINVAYDNGLLASGENAYKALVSNDDVYEFCAMMSEGLSTNEIYACMISRGVKSPNSLFSMIYYRKSWKRISAPFIFPYYNTSVPTNIPISIIREICNKLAAGCSLEDIQSSLNIHIDINILSDISRGYFRISKPLYTKNNSEEYDSIFSEDEIFMITKLLSEHASQKQILYKLGYDKCLTPEIYGNTYDEYYHRMVELDKIAQIYKKTISNY